MKKLFLLLFACSFTFTYSQSKVYIWQNNVVIDSMDITNSLRFSFLAGTDTTANGLLAYFPFNGNANDATGRGNDGSVHGAVLTKDRFGNPNRAYRFANGAYIDVPRSTLIEPKTGLTCVAWVCPDMWDSAGTILVKRYSEAMYPYNSYGLVRPPSAQNRWQFYTSYNSILMNPDTVRIKEWQFLVGTWDGTKNSFYVDGVKVAENGNKNSIPYSTLSLRIGVARLDGIIHQLDQCFNGVIDDIRIYNRALTASEIDALYHEGGWKGN